MLQNAYFLAKIGADTAENEEHFAEFLPKIGNYVLSSSPPSLALPADQSARPRGPQARTQPGAAAAASAGPVAETARRGSWRGDESSQTANRQVDDEVWPGCQTTAFLSCKICCGGLVQFLGFAGRYR